MFETLTELVKVLAFVAWSVARSAFYCVVQVLPFNIEPRKSVDNEVVLITGAAMGIGRLQALHFARLGAHVVLWDINEELMAGVEEEIQAAGGQATSFCVNLAKPEDIYAAADKVKEEVGAVTILVNNAGVVSGKPLMDTPDARIELTFRVNVLCHFYTIKAFLPAMLEANHGHIVTIASNAGKVGVSGLVDYCASKHAAVGLDEALRMELCSMGATGVHTTVVCPLAINTGMFDGVKNRFEWLTPTLDSAYVAGKIVDAVLKNQAELFLPRSSYLLPIFRLLPTDAYDAMGRFLGGHSFMSEFKGREGGSDSASAKGTSKKAA